MLSCCSIQKNRSALCAGVRSPLPSATPLTPPATAQPRLAWERSASPAPAGMWARPGVYDVYVPPAAINAQTIVRQPGVELRAA